MIEIRELTENNEFVEAVKLQKAIWGFDDIDLLPVRLFVTASKIGGHSFGAFDGSKMVGYCIAIPGIKPGAKGYLHSHMLGVTKGYRDAGLGRKLKLAQREHGLRQGVDLMEWTFDPTEIRNAHLNIARLGVIVRRYQPDFYGPSSSPLQGGLPTDRLYAEWWLRSNRVAGILRGEAQPIEVIERIIVPHAIYQWKQDPQQRNLALALQSKNREALESAFHRDLAVIGYERDGQGNGTFLLGRWK